MTRYHAKEKMYDHLNSEYDLTRSEAKGCFEMQIIDEIFDSFEQRVCKNCTFDYCGCSVQDSLLQVTPEANLDNFGCVSFERKGVFDE